MLSTQTARRSKLTAVPPYIRQGGDDDLVPVTVVHPSGGFSHLTFMRLRTALNLGAKPDATGRLYHLADKLDDESLPTLSVGAAHPRHLAGLEDEALNYDALGSAPQPREFELAAKRMTTRFSDWWRAREAQAPPGNMHELAYA